MSQSCSKTMVAQEIYNNRAIYALGRPYVAALINNFNADKNIVYVRTQRFSQNVQML